MDSHFISKLFMGESSPLSKEILDKDKKERAYGDTKSKLLTAIFNYGQNSYTESFLRDMWRNVEKPYKLSENAVVEVKEEGQYAYSLDVVIRQMEAIALVARLVFEKISQE